MSDGVLLVHHIARLRSSCPAFYLNTAALVRQGCKDAQRRWNPDQVRWSHSTTHGRLITWLILFTLESCWPKSSSFWDNGVFSVSASEMCFWILPKIQTQVNEARQDSLPVCVANVPFYVLPASYCGRVSTSCVCVMTGQRPSWGDATVLRWSLIIPLPSALNLRLVY